MTFVPNRAEQGEALAVRWRAAVYVRLSKEDGDKLESDSIQNQKRIIEQHIRYLQEQGEHIDAAQIYADDGYPGGSFDRPAYQRMIAAIESGDINCVICKDNSRLGRNYTALGRLMEEYFPQKGVRVISVLNHLDSLKDPQGYCSALVSFANIMNDDYIRQLSLKIKCTFAMKRERGEFLGNYAPYGYVKSPENRHKLVIDAEAAAVVRRIFDWYAGGASISEIIRQLDALQIMPPSLYKTSQGCKGFAKYGDDAGRQHWSSTSVRTILRDEVYIGNLVQGKYKSASYRTKKMIPAAPREWTVVEGTHEAIIPDELFAIVHERLARRMRTAPRRQAAYPLSGFVRCAHCGGHMNRHTTGAHIRYRCATRAADPDKCRCPSVKESILEAVLLQALQEQIAALVDAKAVMAAVRRSGADGHSHSAERLALRRAVQERDRLREAQFRLYDRLEQGLIDQSEYAQFKERYQAELAEQQRRIDQLQSGLHQSEQAHRQHDALATFFARHGTIPAIDRAVTSQLLRYIVVTDSAHIDIYFKFSAARQVP